MSYKDKFGGTKDAPVDNKREWLPPGDYEVDVVSCHTFIDRAKTERYVVIYKVVEASKTEDNEPGKVGREYNWLQDFAADMANQNMKGFMIAAMQIEASDVDAIAARAESIPELLAESIDPKSMKEKDPVFKNSLKGTRIHVTVKTKEKKNSEGTFPLHVFGPSLKPKTASAPAAAK